ncbi:hypothetical protein [Clostridium sp.]|jgi:hypothetical protein|uniref:hypothetical protein n=1 Tax=Clostridium sp. TaxID=1506 RepID=UPI002586311F|nr:hypothetical protein [Clostridium sp.]MDF2503866.1 hypothetical protein [Clostridium sp.]
MNCNVVEYVFYEWIIIEKQITVKDFLFFSNQRKIDLKKEFISFISQQLQMED